MHWNISCFSIGRLKPQSSIFFAVESRISLGDSISASGILYHVIRDTYRFISFYRGFIRNISFDKGLVHFLKFLDMGIMTDEGLPNCIPT